MEFADELRSKVKAMRALGITEMETGSGYVRRLVLSPDAPELPEPEAPTAEPATEAEAKQAEDDAEAAREKRSMRRRFGAGLPAGAPK